MKNRNYFGHLIIILTLCFSVSSCQKGPTQATPSSDERLHTPLPEATLATLKDPSPYPAITPIAYPFSPTATAIPKPIEIVYLTAEKPLIVRSAPDVNADAISELLGFGAWSGWSNTCPDAPKPNLPLL